MKDIGFESAGNGWDPSQRGSMDDYIRDIAVPQVREILTKYGDNVPAVLWWDTPEGMIALELEGADVDAPRPDVHETKSIKRKAKP